jgi:hypothetical protein
VSTAKILVGSSTHLEVEPLRSKVSRCTLDDLAGDLHDLGSGCVFSVTQAAVLFPRIDQLLFRNVAGVD